MPFPSPVTGVGRRFKPALRREDVVAPIAVDIARANPVTVALRADDVFYKGAIADLEPRKRGFPLAELRKQLTFLAVVVKIHQEREFDGIAVLDRVFLPLTAALSRILHPIELACEIGATDEDRKSVV